MHIYLRIHTQLLDSMFSIGPPTPSDIREMHLSIWAEPRLEKELLIIVDKIKTFFKIQTLNRLPDAYVAKSNTCSVRRKEYNFKLIDQAERIDKLLREFGFMIKI